MTPDWERDGVQLFCRDCREVLPIIESVDHVITDPPYGDRTNIGARTGSGDKVLIDYAAASVESLSCTLGMAIGLSRRWSIIWYDVEGIGDLSRLWPDLYIRCGIWRKPDATPQFTGDRPAMWGEACAIFHATGKKRWNNGGYPAFWEFNTERDRYGHPTPKPIGLMQAQVIQFTDPGETVLDFFMGSGTTGVACVKLGRKFIGCEISREYFDIAVRRIESAIDETGLLDWAAKPEQAEIEI